MSKDSPNPSMAPASNKSAVHNIKVPENHGFKDQKYEKGNLSPVQQFAPVNPVNSAGFTPVSPES